MSKRVPINEFIMPIGKYKGKSLPEIHKLDNRYLLWAAENIKSNIGTRCNEFLQWLDEQGGEGKTWTCQNCLSVHGIEDSFCEKCGADDRFSQSELDFS